MANRTLLTRDTNDFIDYLKSGVYKVEDYEYVKFGNSITILHEGNKVYERYQGYDERNNRPCQIEKAYVYEILDDEYETTRVVTAIPVNEEHIVYYREDKRSKCGPDSIVLKRGYEDKDFDEPITYEVLSSDMFVYKDSIGKYQLQSNYSYLVDDVIIINGNAYSSMREDFKTRVTSFVSEREDSDPNVIIVNESIKNVLESAKKQIASLMEIRDAISDGKYSSHVAPEITKALNALKYKATVPTKNVEYQEIDRLIEAANSMSYAKHILYAYDEDLRTGYIADIKHKLSKLPVDYSLVMATIKVTDSKPSRYNKQKDNSKKKTNK